MRPESTVTTATSLAQPPGTEGKRAQIAAVGGLGEALRAGQERLCGLGEYPWIGPDSRPRLGSHPMAFPATCRKPVGERRRETFDLMRIVCDDGPIRVRAPHLAPERFDRSAQGFEMVLAGADDLLQSSGTRAAGCADEHHGTD